MNDSRRGSKARRVLNVRDALSLDGRLAVVIGASARLGRSICEALGEAGATVVATSRERDRAQQLCSELTSQGTKALPEALDVRSRESLQAAHDRIVAGHGEIDVLVNAAVARYPYTPVEELTWEDWETDLAVNVFGVYASNVVFAQSMLRRKAGSIINIGSIYGMGAVDHSIYPDLAMSTGIRYAASKGAVLQVTRYLAALWGEAGVRVNCLSLGGVYASQPEAFVEAYSRRTPMKRMASVHEIKGAIVYLSSDASTYVTGHNLVVDGGWTAW